jgi:hypothetical protein
MTTLELLVRKDQLSTSRLRERDDTPLAPDQVRARIDRFALTANNITYAAFGDAMNYWQFFPMGEEGWGIVPVWGFADVVQSEHPGVAVGERLYGYWPMASHTVLTPTHLTQQAFVEGAPHRAALHGVYNQLLRCAADPLYTADTEDVQALLRPLFTTSWLIDDFFADNDFFGARTLLLSSASSKTAYGTAVQLQQREGVERIGLTSAANRAFCESLGCYDRVLSYEELGQIAPDTPCAYIDFAGSAPLRQAIHTRFAALKYSCSIGGTHLQELGGARDLPGPRATLFFAPAQVKKRIADWGGAVLQQRLGEAWHGFVARVTQPQAPWLVARQHRGPEAVATAYAQVLAGGGDPREGHMLSFAR